MKAISNRLLIAVATTLVCASGAYAQDEYCNQQARKICGDNQTISQCFEDQDMWSNLDPDCTGTVQTIIENEREATQQENDYSAVNLYGQSYGGVLRSGPGQEFSQVASLREGDSVEIIEDPDVWWNGYKWFKVRTPRGVGYHWGGIICVPSDTPPRGIYSNCQ
ncbi:SH3 domain-containing protein [Rhizobium sp.]